MTETAAASAPEPVKAKSPKKKAVKAGGAAKAKPTHPPTAEMVNAAVGTLKERGGSSLQAIKKYISATYKVDAEKLAPFIRKYIKGAVASGKLVQTKGTGAAGSFKLPGGAKVEGEKKKAAKPKKAAAKKESPARKPKKAPTKAKKVKKPPTTPKAPKIKKAAKSPAKPKKPVAKKAAKKPAKKASPKK